jgi:hypothetical protein
VPVEPTTAIMGCLGGGIVVRRRSERENMRRPCECRGL